MDQGSGTMQLSESGYIIEWGQRIFGQIIKGMFEKLFGQCLGKAYF